MLKRLKVLLKLIKAMYRIDMDAVCEMSKGKGLHNDYHEYTDSYTPYPMHFHTYTCKRCGKQFTI